MSSNFQLSKRVDPNKIFLIKVSELEGRLDPFFNSLNKQDKSGKYEFFKLKELAYIRKGDSITSDNVIDGDIPVIAGGRTSPYNHNIANNDGDIITVSASGAYSGYVWYHKQPVFASDCTMISSLNTEKLSNRFLFEYLKFEQQDIYNLQQGSGQPHIYPSDLEKIKIPIPPKEVQVQIVAKMDATYIAKKQKEAEARRLLDSIDDYLLGELGIELPEQEENTIASRMFERRLSEVSGGRFDPNGSYPYFENIIDAIDKSKYPIYRVKNLINKISRPFYPLKNKQYSYIQLGSIGRENSEVEQVRKIQLPDIPSRAQQVVMSGELLFSTANPQWGVHIYVKDEYSGYAASSGFFILNSKGQNNIYIIELLRTNLYRELYKKYLTGAGLFLNISERDLMSLKIPLPSLAKQTEIAEHISQIRQQAKQHQNNAEIGLERAKKEVETMILG